MGEHSGDIEINYAELCWEDEADQ